MLSDRPATSSSGNPSLTGVSIYSHLHTDRSTGDKQVRGSEQLRPPTMTPDEARSFEAGYGGTTSKDEDMGVNAVEKDVNNDDKGKASSKTTPDAGEKTVAWWELDMKTAQEPRALLTVHNYYRANALADVVWEVTKGKPPNLRWYVLPPIIAEALEELYKLRMKEQVVGQLKTIWYTKKGQEDPIPHEFIFDVMQLKQTSTRYHTARGLRRTHVQMAINTAEYVGECSIKILGEESVLIGDPEELQEWV